MMKETNGRLRWWITTALTLAVLLTAVAGGLAVLRADVQRHEADIKANEKRSVTNREDVIEMKADLKYIRTAVDKLGE